MSTTECSKGCVGCIDHATNNGSCDYLFNNGHCRPCKADEHGCALYSKWPRYEDETEEERRTWDTEEARRLLAEDMPVDEVAAKIGASVNSLQVWIRVGMPATPAPKERAAGKRAAKGIWNEEVYRELYAKGLTDPEAAKRMGLDSQTVWKHRRRLGLPANGLKKRRVTQ